ncbi:PaaX family transcriptional regulator [Pseudonocardia sp. KRD-184]|uniref:PaaX family transcriptional regulator n=1 Tax=Pseudonocardia oceani TaxID=2792013 RepID=A0ABS6UCZ7_9PSEU|nr:PaaX family transcriptional regulator C-terminal domain-containing protein [Pseudonocardia oceani]MBW0089036.1 PaaX family transcriptional regulator [Pseudonocardia oceani]MBW0094743.1 PaaX family transcriptional regulator [Pseudonocardia oceani]MBW0110739.1 PaaX family transcriptional regulator [Pseudonocardia oceani]MBW0121367.1 PaaX family transcriptional regulator [Pseudonocardia oceani]MBW0130115.1 PaaX family transcriptional regulator [Pseudonocardia oceani]
MTLAEDAAEVGVAAAPRALIVSLYGLYARQQDGWLSVASVVRMMAEFGVDGQAVRSSVFRLKRRGLLIAEKVGRAAGYRLSDVGQDILAEGDSRIFSRRRGTLDEGWLLVTFSVPEAEREKRHLLRTQLARLGLGTVAPGLWIAPAHRETEVAAALERAGLRGFTDLFRSHHVSSRPARETVRTWWDLDALDAVYAEFVQRFEPVRARWAADPDGPGARAFTDFVEVVTAWRRLPYLDPGLPLEVLPVGWVGVTAEDLFAALRERLAGPAATHARALLAGQA